jgi:hypothetical protein
LFAWCNVQRQLSLLALRLWLWPGPEEESITSYSCFSIGWGLFLALAYRHKIQGTTVYCPIRRT